MKPEFGFSSGIVISIAKIDAGDLGCQCREHRVCCGKVACVDMVVRLCRKTILVPDSYSSKEIMREVPVITVNWVTEGFDHCHVGFLPRLYVPNATIYDGVLCQVTEVFEKYDHSCAISKKWKK